MSLVILRCLPQQKKKSNYEDSEQTFHLPHLQGFSDTFLETPCVCMSKTLVPK